MDDSGFLSVSIIMIQEALEKVRKQHDTMMTEKCEIYLLIFKKKNHLRTQS